MQIQGNGAPRDLANLVLGVQDTGRSFGRSSGNQGTNGDVHDQVQISQNAKDIQRVKELASQDDPTRAQKVSRIQQEIARGTYNIAGQQVADALIHQTLTDTVV